MNDATDIEAIILVYNADWGLRGGVDYLLDLLRGTDECALCDITHRTVFEKADWKSCRGQLGVPVEVRYRNQLDKELAAVVQGDFPAVLARTKDGYVKLLGRAALEDCAADPKVFFERLQQSRAEKNLA